MTKLKAMLKVVFAYVQQAKSLHEITLLTETVFTCFKLLLQSYV